MPHSEEHHCVVQAQAGDRDAFATLVGAYWGRVYRWLHELTRHTHQAEDLTQEVFLRAWASLRSFKAGTNFRAWLFRIAANCLTDTKRGPRATPTQPLADSVAAREPGPVVTALTRESETLLREALARLSVDYRAAFLLRTQENFSFREIAVALGLTEETARWRVFKARQLLLKELALYLDEESHDV